jgi:16S rRNA (adenine1518-N6/adenine1519-N6)-dimethyltransferase
MRRKYQGLSYMPEEKIRPKKSLGQTFLIDKNIQRKIIEAAGLRPSDTVLEIGAGRGELTRLIIGKVKRIYAVEIDQALAERLKEEFSDNVKIKIINQDILRFDLKKCAAGVSDGIRVIGNIPYYASTAIVEYLLEYRSIVRDIFITVQKEFGQRMAALPGGRDYGSFSCFVQYYAHPEILFTIKKTSFWRQPKVDSCLLYLKVREEPAVKVKDEDSFFRVIRSAFNKRRKTLRNSLAGVIDSARLNLFFQRYHIDPDIRPQDLSLQDFTRLLSP